MTDSPAGHRKREFKPKYLAIGTIMIICGSAGAYFLISWNNDIMTQTGIIMSHVTPDCYVFLQNKNDTNAADAQVAYYSTMVGQINSSGVKYIGPFLRSPAFIDWLFQNCPAYNGTQSIFQLRSYNASLADQSHHIWPSVELQQKVKTEQSMLQYDYKKNADNFTNVYDIANHFKSDVQSVVDNMFLSGTLDINGMVTKDGTPNGPALSECHNPSWLENSTIRQCSIYNSTIVVNKYNQDIMVQPEQSSCKVTSCTINGTLMLPSFVAKMFGR